MKTSAEIAVDNQRIIELEATIFAMHLLIPEEMIMRDIVNGFDITDGKAIDQLASKYRVPSTIMAMRLGHIMFARA